MIAAAHALDLLTTPYVFNPDEARDMVRAGADIVVAHMGVTTGGAIGAKTGKSLDACAGEIDAIAAAARAVRSDIIVLCHGGPIAAPADAEYVLRRVDRCHGFYGASSMERLPAEAAITRQTADFKAITFGDVSGGDAKRDGHPRGNLVHPDDVRAFGSIGASSRSRRHLVAQRRDGVRHRVGVASDQEAQAGRRGRAHPDRGSGRHAARTQTHSRRNPGRLCRTEPAAFGSVIPADMVAWATKQPFQKSQLVEPILVTKQNAANPALWGNAANG